MTFLAVIIVFLIVRWFGSVAFLQHDQWYFRFCRWLAARSVLSYTEGAVFFCGLIAPLLVVFVLLFITHQLWSGLEIIIAVPALLYAVGRKEFRPLVDDFIAACERNDWPEAVNIADQLDCDVSGVADQDWTTLSHRTLYAASYRGFERQFAVLFWFIALGAIGAVMYRLTELYARNADAELKDQAAARRCLWLIEWPAARVLGISFAITGNFVGCFNSWRHHFWGGEVATPDVLGQCVEGALNVEQGESQSLAISEKELRWMASLYYRTLIFWMCVLAGLAIAF